MFSFVSGALVVLIVLLVWSLKILREYERGVVFQLGRFWAVKGPGLFFLIPVGQHELDALLAEREQLNIDIQKTLDAQTETWGIKVSNVEIKDVDLNETMVRA